MISLLFALPQESRPFLQRLASPRRHSAFVSGRLAPEGPALLVGHCGVGPEKAALSIAALLSSHRPRCVISAGFAGGLDARLRVGDLLVATNFSSPALVDCARATAFEQRPLFLGPLLSQSRVIESVAEKSRLALRTGALAVDMETAAIAQACAWAGVPFLAVRVISDAASDALPVPMAHWFDLQRQRLRPLALLRFLVTHPARIVPFARFVRGLAPARRTLAAFLVHLLAHPAFSAAGTESAPHVR